MGAFFLHKGSDSADVDAVIRQFTDRGFKTPRRVILLDQELLLWHRQATGDLDIAENSPRGDFAASIGTLVYRSLHGSDAVETLLGDVHNNALAWGELIGSFVVVLRVGSRILLLNDRLQVQPVFVDRARRWASSSFLAIVAATTTRRTLNRLAVIEKLSTGYIVGPDTILEGIEKATESLQRNWAGHGWSFLPPPYKQQAWDCGDVSRRTRSRSDAVQLQADSLHSYLRAIRPLCEARGCVLGLSAGYDSRLLFAFACGEIPRLKVQTHWTKGVPGHELDRRIVAKWAQERDVECIIHPTAPAHALNGTELDDLARDCLRFFDGRNSHNMGAMSQVYSREYSIKTLGSTGLRLNGLGGEIYRNYYFTAPRTVDFRQWLLAHVYYPTARQAVKTPSLFEEMHRSKVRKMRAILSAELGSAVPWVDLRRYYSEVRMPECDGVNANAHNQIAPYLLPFVEWAMIGNGYCAIPHIGLSGRFQADLIACGSPALAGGPSHYGFPLDREPLSHRLKAAIKGYLPEELANHLTAIRRRIGAAGAASQRSFGALVERSAALRDSLEALQTHMPEIELTALLSHTDHGNNGLFVGSLLCHIDSKIR